MILFVLSIAIMNFGLGYALAVVLSDAPLALPEILRKLRAAATEDDEPTRTDPPHVADLPPPWLTQLQAAALTPRSFWEGLLLKLWVEIAPLREQLLTAEVRGRLALSRLDQPAEVQLLADVRNLQVLIRSHLQDVLSLLQQHFELLEIPANTKENLEEELELRLARAARCEAELAACDIEKEPELGTRQLLGTLTEWIDQLHVHRDQVQELLAGSLRDGGDLNDSGQPLYLDPLTGQISRLGLENLLELWWQEDPQRLRLVSCALVDVDRFARLNQRLGYRAGDRVLHSIAGLLQGGIRTDRGYDRLVRFAGNQFLLFFGDTGPKNAAIGLERIRQSLEAVTMDYEGNEFDVTVSIGVAAIRREDGPEQFFSRLQDSLYASQKHGRNRTSVDDGDGPNTLFEPQRHSVRAKRVRIET